MVDLNNHKCMLFQNISCYCLTCRYWKYKKLFSISKHLMLLFNFIYTSLIFLKNKFQNISCYCLTITKNCINLVKELFQNISCYCLTHRKITDHWLWEFQNISCYCLTLKQFSLFLQFPHFKTSHVIV